jgi:exosome complex component RRP40
MLLSLSLAIAPPNVTKKDWMTGLAIYGELLGGYVFKTSIPLAKNLLQDDSYVLQALGKSIAFEIAIGLNGVIWVNSQSTKHTTIVTNAILNSEAMGASEIDFMVQQLIATGGNDV